MSKGQKNRSVSPLRQIIFIIGFAGRFLWKSNPRLFLAVIFLNSVSSLIIVPNLLLDKYFIDILVTNIGKPNPEKTLKLILLIVAARLALALFRTISNRLSGFYSRSFFWHNNQQLEVLVGEKYATISVPVLEDPKFKDRYNRLEREGLHRVQRVGENFVRIPQHITGIFSSLSFFFTTEPLVVAVSLLSLLPSVVVDRIYIKKDYQLDQQVTLLHRKRGMYYYYLGRSRSYLESRLLNIHKYLSRKVYDLWEEIIVRRLRLLRSWRTLGFLAGIIDNTVSYSFDAIFGYQAIISKITIGTAQAYIRAISTFKSSVTDLTTNLMELYENYFYLNDLHWFLNLDTPYYNNSGPGLPPSDKIKINFDRVWFKYPGSKNWILKGVTFDINPGENIALVGKNGAGKTTLVKLLCGYYAPQKGRVTISGININDINKVDYWSKLSVLFQDSDAFGITVREIIAAGNISKIADQKSVIEHAKLAQIDEWIQSLPLKYDNPIGRDFEKGVSPSSGQWQRLAIARTLFKNPEIMVLDEPTSNVDPQAEENIFNQILATGLDKIILFISHRFSTVRRANKILVLENGKISEQGTHDQLLNADGTYARLFRLQAKNYQ